LTALLSRRARSSGVDEIIAVPAAVERAHGLRVEIAGGRCVGR
jgi:hypothetical protein